MSNLAMMMGLGSGAGGGAVWNADFGNASYDSVNFSLSSQQSSTRGLYFHPEGTQFWSVGYTADYVHQYDMSTPWDISTASYSGNRFYVANQASTPKEVTFNNDGTKMYITQTFIYEYELSTAWDVTTAVYNSNSVQLNGYTSSPESARFNSDGTKLYFIGNTNTIYTINLSTAFDLGSTASNALETFNFSSQEAYSVGLWVSSTDEYFYIFGEQTNNVYEYQMSTIGDVSTASYTGNSVSGFASPTAVAFKSDGTKMYLTGMGDDVRQYTTG